MNPGDFRAWSHRAADWGADYRETLRDKPVRAQVQPGDIARQLGAAPPELPEAMEAIFADFETIIAPGMTHWQHPRFFAYFPANAAPASVVAEYLVSAMAAQCMLWQTSPAATELETRMMEWLRQALGLAGRFHRCHPRYGVERHLCRRAHHAREGAGMERQQFGFVGPSATTHLCLSAESFFRRQGHPHVGYRRGQPGAYCR